MSQFKKTIFLTDKNSFLGKSLYKGLSKKYRILTIPTNFRKNDILQNVRDSNFVVHCRELKGHDHQIRQMFLENFEFSKTLFRFAESGCVPVVYFSSASVYGNDDYPISAYGWSKLAAEDFGYNYCSSFISLRCFDIYGPGEKSSIIYKLANTKQKEFELLPISTRKDFIHIDDVVEANLMILKNIDFLQKGIYDVGNGENIDIFDLVKLFNLKPKWSVGKDTPNDYQYFMEANKFKWPPGWKPKISLGSGIKKIKTEKA